MDEKTKKIKALEQKLQAAEKENAQLRSDERRYREIYKGSREGFVIVNADGRIIDANAAYCDMLGYSLDELRNLANFYEITPKRWRQWEHEEIWKNRLIKKGHSGRYEKEYIRKNGTVFPVELQSYTVRDDAGEIDFFWGCARDISRPKATEQALLQSQQKAERYLNIAAEIIISLDSQGKITMLNESGHQMLGYDKDELIGKDWFSTCLPRGIKVEVRKIFKKLMQGQVNGVSMVEGEVVTKAGKLKTILWHNSILKDDRGKITGILSSGLDITERKQAEAALHESERKYHSILDNASAVIFIKDKKGKYQFVNRMFASIHGISNEQIRGLTDKDIFPAALARNFRKNDRKVLQSAEPITIEEPVPHKDGIHTVLSTKFPLFDREGKPYATCGIATDITERKRTEEALNKSEKFSRDLINSMTDGFSILDAKGVHINVNPAFCDMTGYNRDELIGTGPPHPYWPEEEYDNIKKAFSEVLTGGSMHVELIFKKKNGERFPVSISPSQLKDEKGNIVSNFATVKDISDRKQAEWALLEKERESSAMLDRMLNAFVLFESVFDDAGNFVSYRFLKINRAYEEITGVKQKDVRGKTVHEVWPETEPEWIKRYGRVAVTGEPSEFELYHDPTKKLYHCQVYRPFDTSEKFCVIFEDITERKKIEQDLLKSEQKYRMLFENMHDGFALHEMVLDNTGVPVDYIFLIINSAFEKLTGLKATDIISKKVTEALPGIENDPADWIGTYGKVALKGKNLKFQQYSSVLNKWFAVSAYRPRKNQFATIFQDITEQKKTEKELEEHREHLEVMVKERTRKLEIANNELQDFVYSVSHDLRAPLRSIMGFSEIISKRHRDNLNEEGQRYFNFIVDAAGNMTDLIEDLLHYSRLGTKRYEKIELGDIIKNVLKKMEKDINEFDAEIVRPDNPPAIISSRLLLDQIFFNLIHNAIKYHRPNVKPTVKISCKNDKNKTTIKVSDNGIGIRSKYHDKIFNIFQRLHAQDEYPGTGIGLAIVKKSVNVLDGTVRVESQVGHGSTFTIELPKIPEE